AFKRSLQKVPLGTEVLMDAPWGELVLDADESIPSVFLTGGIGITPVRSVVLQATHDKLTRKLVLFYSNRHPGDAAFLDELTQAEKANPNFTMIATMTKMEGSSKKWDGETCQIDEALLKKHLKDLTKPIYYLCGPPKMVTAMQELLKKAGVKDANVRAEEFSGY
ncbi:MAG: FAD-dependent oxidoreductase, partial [Bryocella sp.]